ncbi:MAG: SDR family oxidoreductase [Armatimonadetes bacterium]|nr:SDR family oxidoreductase [Armatimonadota bacterium]
MADRLVGKTALVTGAAQGIGAAILDLFAQEGATAWGVDRTPGATDFTLDLANVAEIPDFIRALPSIPDVLVNCAGICLTRPFFDIEVDGFERTFKINVTASFVLMQELAWHLKEGQRPGSIINMASNSGLMPKLEQLDYGASKAAVISMTRSAAASLGPHGIRVNAIAPGVIDTPLTQSIAKQRSEIRGVPPEETLRPVLDSLPLRRMGTADEVANVALFLASDESAFVTGQTYLVDGGQLMH